MNIGDKRGKARLPPEFLGREEDEGVAVLETIYWVLFCTDWVDSWKLRDRFGSQERDLSSGCKCGRHLLTE